jgi:serine/threonine protein kinase
MSDHKRKVVEKVLLVDPGHTDHLPIEIQALEMLPDCNRIVKPLHYARDNQDPQYGKAMHEHYHLGDLEEWRARVLAKNFKPVSESYIWRLFLQMAQALALLQNRIGPDRNTRKILLHCDIKPENLLVVDNGTTSSSF